MLMVLTFITPAMPGYYKDAHGKQGKILPVVRYPFTKPGSSETIADKMPCLGEYALGGLKPSTLWQGESTLHYK